MTCYMYMSFKKNNKILKPHCLPEERKATEDLTQQAHHMCNTIQRQGLYN